MAPNDGNGCIFQYILKCTAVIWLKDNIGLIVQTNECIYTISRVRGSRPRQLTRESNKECRIALKWNFSPSIMPITVCAEHDWECLTASRGEKSLIVSCCYCQPVHPDARYKTSSNNKGMFGRQDEFLEHPSSLERRIREYCADGRQKTWSLR